MSTKDTVRIVVVDDHRIFQLGVIDELQRADPSIEVVGTAATVDEAITVIGREKPDVVLLDVHLPGGHGGGGAEVARSVGEEVRCLGLSVSDAADDVIAVIRAGARGYVTKSFTGEDLADAVHRIAEGDAVFSPRLAGFVLDAFRGQAPPRPTELDLLSPRETEVMKLIARGYTYRETASELFISDRTVETHMSNVLKKLQVSNRYELTRWARDRFVI